MIQFVVVVNCIANIQCGLSAPYRIGFKEKDQAACVQSVSKIMDQLGYNHKQFTIRCEKK